MPVVVAAIKNREVMISGITVGVIGYVFGNYWEYLCPMYWGFSDFYSELSLSSLSAIASEAKQSSIALYYFSGLRRFARNDRQT